ncbi:MAG TPA: plastocyanin/azurin family copper-binding protein [Candidatus Nitrosocosmicus sp.]|nr:plastocyanin/azurin family copper-binding protein [Candidatus Nitrosocosmicus sp.]
MKLLETGILMGILVAGLLLSPMAIGVPLVQKVMAQEDEEEDQGPVKQVLLVANENPLKIAPDNILHPGGIEYAAMTFNGTIPGPVIAGDQGDILNITIRNDGKTIHSLDFHAGIGPSNVLSGNIEPGQTKHVTLHANTPGAFMYHCGADALNGVWEHISNGMYGAVVIHPDEETEAKEFYVSFGEIYNSADGGLFKGSGGTVGTFDITKFATDQPDLVLTNGMAHKYVPAVGEKVKLELNKTPEIFKVKPGELTRWYILNPGPNSPVAFHFIAGMISQRDGTVGDDYGTQVNMDETMLVPPGSASVFEATFPEAGTYVAVDHNMNHVVKGAAFAVVADANSTENDHPVGTAVAPKGSESAVASWNQPYVMKEAAKLTQVTAATAANATTAAAAANATTTTTTTTVVQNATLVPEAFAQDMMGNDTTMMNATLAFAQDMMGNETGMMGNDTTMMNATLAFAQEEAKQEISIVSGSSNPSNAEFFSPSEVTVSPGTEVEWTNDDATIHTVVQGSAEAPVEGGFDSSIISTGDSWEHTFDTAGTFDYYCSLHPFMKGTVTVA